MLPEIQLDYMFMGTAVVGEQEKDKVATPGSGDLVTALHAVDVDSLARMAVVADKGPVDYVVKAVLDFISEIGRTRCILRSDNEPAVKALVAEIVKQREHETIVEEVPKASSATQGTVEHGNYQIGALVRTLRFATEKRLSITIKPDSPAAAWMFRHAAWLLNRYSVGRDGATPYERYKGKPYSGEVCEFMERSSGMSRRQGNTSLTQESPKGYG